MTLQDLHLRLGTIHARQDDLEDVGAPIPRALYSQERAVRSRIAEIERAKLALSLIPEFAILAGDPAQFEERATRRLTAEIARLERLPVTTA